MSGSSKPGKAAVPRSRGTPSAATGAGRIEGAPLPSAAPRGRPAQIHEDPPPYRVAAAATAPLRFIDLFCGIGGFRIAFEKAGGKCVFSSDWDKYSRQTYKANFGEEPHGDIHSVAVADIPPHDILCGGFPCQPFSLAGVSKKNSLGRKHGFTHFNVGMPSSVR